MNKKPILAVPQDSTADQGWHFNEGRIVRDADLEINRNIAQDAGIRGVHQNEGIIRGQLQLVEINSRLGGGTIFPTLARANFQQ